MVFQRKKTEKSTALSVRAIAAQVILQVLDQGKSLSTLLPEVQSQVKPQDLPLLQEITFGICRVLPRLENIIKKLLDKPLKGKPASCTACYWWDCTNYFICACPPMRR